MNTTNTTVSTKATAIAEAVKTALVLNWDDCTPEDIQALAQQALIVKLQSGWRKNGIPAEVTVKVADHKPGARAPKVEGKAKALSIVASMSPAERATFLADLQAQVAG